MTTRPLDGIRVVELAGLAPAPFAGMVLADFGADVVRVDRASKGKIFAQPDVLGRGKRSIALDLKSKRGLDALKRLVKSADVLVEPFRPGVMERLGLGPEVLCKENPKLIYVRMTGFGQGGDPAFRDAPGHDINYLATSGILSALRRKGERPLAPVNLLGDFAGGGMMCAWGIVLALFERTRSGKGQVIDAAMIDGASYVSSFVWKAWQAGGYENSLETTGTNLLDSGAFFYDTYECKDGRYVSVGAIEKKFYSALLTGMGLDIKEMPSRWDQANWPEMTRRFTEVFKSKTRDEWGKVFEGTEACCFPVLDMQEATQLKHNKMRRTFGQIGMEGNGSNVGVEEEEEEQRPEPMPAPKLSRTPGRMLKEAPGAGGNTRQVLKEWAGFSTPELDDLCASGDLVDSNVEGGGEKTGLAGLAKL